jgi:thiol:disulfide interchange protein DsbA
MKNINLLTFIRNIFLGLICIGFSNLALSQGRPIEEGFDYRVLPVAQATESKGKIEVLEFFWYG